MQLKWLAQKNAQAVDAVPEMQLLGTCVKVAEPLNTPTQAVIQDQACISGMLSASLMLEVRIWWMFWNRFPYVKVVSKGLVYKAT